MLAPFFTLVLAATSLLASARPVPTKRSTLPQLGGVNIAGLDFGMSVWGWSEGAFVEPPSAQITHFASKGANLFRIPFGWQYLTGTPGGAIKADFFAKLDNQVQTALKASSGTYVILDLHNYARFESKQVGTEVPAADFANLWSQLAKKYAGEARIIFGLMNEPHDMTDYGAFVKALQAAVTAIRSAGATSQFILLPGNDWTHATEMMNKNGQILIDGVKDTGADQSKLLLDIHQYLDSDGSGTQGSCTTNNVALFQQLSSYLKSKGRQAIVSETGAAFNNADCITKLGEQLAYIKSVPETIAGYTVWSAGAFDNSYVLNIVPNGETDNEMAIKAVIPNFPAKSGSSPVVTSKQVTSTSSTAAAVTSTSKAAVSVVTPKTSTTSIKAAATTTSKPVVATQITTSAAAASTTKASSGGATAGPWAQCGGAGFTGPTNCASGWRCVKSNDWYSQCLQ